MSAGPACSTKLAAASSSPSQLSFHPSSQSVYYVTSGGAIKTSMWPLWSHQLVFIVSNRKRRLSNRARPLTQWLLIGSGWFTLAFIDFMVAFILREPPDDHDIFLLTTGLMFATFLSSSVIFSLLFSFIFACLPTCYQHLLPLPVALASASPLTHSWVTDQNPLLSTFHLHFALTVWKDHLHVCDEEIIDIFRSGLLCRCQSPGKLLSPLTSVPSVFFLLLLSQSDTSSGAFKSAQSSCLFKCTHNYLFIQDE